MEIQRGSLKRLKDEIMKDMRSLTQKYIIISDLDIPENDEKEIKIKILEEVQKTVKSMQDSI